MARVRVDKTVIVRHPISAGVLVTLKAGAAYDRDDPLVKAYRWAFVSDVEQATAGPGERRK